MADAPKQKTFARKLQERIAASRFLSISLLLHAIIVILGGSVVLFKAYVEPPDFEAAGGGLVGDEQACCRSARGHAGRPIKPGLCSGAAYGNCADHRCDHDELDLADEFQDELGADAGEAAEYGRHGKDDDRCGQASRERNGVAVFQAPCLVGWVVPAGLRR
jgi:hypothetical protein